MPKAASARSSRRARPWSRTPARASNASRQLAVNAQTPEHAATIQRVLAIPSKRHDQALVTFLTEHELKALLAGPDQATWIGRRGHALIVLATQTGCPPAS